MISSWNFILLAKGHHWILSKGVKLFDLHFVRSLLGSNFGNRMKDWSEWRQYDQIGGFHNDPGKIQCNPRLRWWHWEWRKSHNLRVLENQINKTLVCKVQKKGSPGCLLSVFPSTLLSPCSRCAGLAQALLWGEPRLRELGYFVRGGRRSKNNFI